MATNMAPTPTGMRRRSYGDSLLSTPVQKAAAVVSVAFLLVGIAGFVPGITTDFDEIEFAGHESGAMLLGIFQVSFLHNLIHIAFGLIGFALLRTAARASAFLIGGGVVYLVLFVYGLIIDQDSDANFPPLNTADNWLHLGLGVGMIALGVALGQRRRPVERADRRI